MRDARLPGSLDLLLSEENILDIYTYGPWRVPDGLIDELSARVDSLIADPRSARLTVDRHPVLRTPAPAVVADVLGLTGLLLGDAAVRSGRRCHLEYDLVGRFLARPTSVRSNWVARPAPWRPPGAELFQVAGDDRALRELAWELTEEILRALAGVEPLEERRTALLGLYERIGEDGDLMDAMLGTPLDSPEWLVVEERCLDAASDETVALLPELTGPVGYLGWVVDGWLAAEERLSRVVTGSANSTGLLAELLLQAGINEVPAELAVGVRGELYDEIAERLPVLSKTFQAGEWRTRIRAYLSRALVLGEIGLARAWLDLAVRFTAAVRGVPGTPVRPEPCAVPVGEFGSDIRRLFRVRRVRHPLTRTAIPPRRRLGGPVDLRTQEPVVEPEPAEPAAAPAAGPSAGPSAELPAEPELVAELPVVGEPPVVEPPVVELPPEPDLEVEPPSPNGTLDGISNGVPNGVPGNGVPGHGVPGHGVPGHGVPNGVAGNGVPGGLQVGELPAPGPADPQPADPTDPAGGTGPADPTEPADEQPADAPTSEEAARPTPAKTAPRAESDQPAPTSPLAQAHRMIDRIVGQPALASALREIANSPEHEVRMLVAGPPGTGRGLTVDVLSRLLAVRGFHGAPLWIGHEEFARLGTATAVAELRDRLTSSRNTQLVGIDGLDRLVNHPSNGKPLAEELNRMISGYGPELQVVGFAAIDGYRRLVDADAALAAWWRVVRTRDFDAADFAQLFGRVIERRGAVVTPDAARSAGELLASTPGEGQLRNARLATYLADLSIDAARRRDPADPPTVDLPDLPPLRVDGNDEADELGQPSNGQPNLPADQSHGQPGSAQPTPPTPPTTPTTTPRTNPRP